MMTHPSMASSNDYKDLLDLLMVTLLEDTIPGIVASLELGEVRTMTRVLTLHLHHLDGQDLENALLERRKVIDYLLKAMRSPVRTSRLISVMFFSELLRHPELLEEKMAKKLILLMVPKMDSSDDLEVCLAAEALGNACKGAPRQVQQLQDHIFDCLCSKLLDDQNLKVVIKRLQALSKLVTQLKKPNLGRIFEKIICPCAAYLNYPNSEIQIYATSLLADLAQNCTSHKKEFSRYVKEFLPYLIIKLHSKDEQVKASGTAALLYCLPYLGCNNVEELLGAGGKKYYRIYEQLWQKEPALLEKMLLHWKELLYMLHDKDAVQEHYYMMRDTVPMEISTREHYMFKGLRRLTGSILPSGQVMA